MARITSWVAGDILKVLTQGDDIYDPATGSYLGRTQGQLKGTLEVVDFLGTLLGELERRGVRYEVAARQLGADLELPRFDGLVDGEPVFTDVRSRFSDVILRRADVSAEPLFAINYSAALPIPTLPGLEVVRNAVGVTAEVGGQTIRFAPPMCITQADADFLLAVLDEAIGAV